MQKKKTQQKIKKNQNPPKTPTPPQNNPLKTIRSMALNPINSGGEKKTS